MIHRGMPPRLETGDRKNNRVANFNRAIRTREIGCTERSSHTKSSPHGTGKLVHRIHQLESGNHFEYRLIFHDITRNGQYRFSHIKFRRVSIRGGYVQHSPSNLENQYVNIYFRKIFP